MVQDTKRDRVWRAILDLSSDPPEYELAGAATYGYDTATGFTKADVEKTVGSDVSKRTIHDVIMTMLDYGILKMVKEPPHASIAEHPITGNRSPADVYQTVL